MAWFFCETFLPFWIILLGLKSSLLYIISEHPYNPHGDTSCLDVARGHASNLICHPCNLHFSLRKYLCPIYFRKQLYFQLFYCFQHSTLLVCHQCNSFSISTGASASCLLLETGLFLVKTTHAMYIRMSKRVFKSIFNCLNSEFFLLDCLPKQG